ncbi:MAG TPA: sigma 54-interacting transcriptional regulator [Candidatus Acidoferrum sp.]|jgi:DNA-binding NtrC family response regulator|nr:sigma 54-interacting transcriptional regulator [Candidatus Acidoferrum sp.]
MELIGRSPQMAALRAWVARVGPLGTPVLITGETGAGKDVVAAAIHKAGPRAGQRLHAFDVAGIPESLFAGEFFGRAPGGSLGAKRGWLEEAHGSSVLFSHVHLWPRALQPALLRVLRERAYVRAGECHLVSVDVRIIVTTSVDPEVFLADGTFSEALYRALSVDSIHVPPLRERVEDIPLLAKYFLARHARDYRKEITGFVPEALSILTSYSWPGNVRELMNVVERAAIFSTNKRIVPDDVAPLLQVR